MTLNLEIFLAEIGHFIRKHEGFSQESPHEKHSKVTSNHEQIPPRFFLTAMSCIWFSKCFFHRRIIGFPIRMRKLILVNFTVVTKANQRNVGLLSSLVFAAFERGFLQNISHSHRKE